MKKLILSLTIGLFLTCAPSLIDKATAQAVTQDGAPTPPYEVPIDGGLTALLAAGLIYGARKLRSEKSQLE